MTQETHGEAGAPAAYDQLLEKSRGKLLELFPELAEKINSPEGERIVELFVEDGLSEAGLPGFGFYRASPAKQKELIERTGKTVDEVFAAPSDSLIKFYREKLGNPQNPQKDPLDEDF